MTHPANPPHPGVRDITPGMWREIDGILTRYRNKSGSLIPVLRKCQDVVSYLPPELLEYISEGLNVSRSEVFGVTTFYSLFSMVPKGRHTIKACMGTACYVRGIKETIRRIEELYGVHFGETTPDRRFSLESVRCLGACGLAPVVVVDHDTQGGVTPDKIQTILERYP